MRSTGSGWTPRRLWRRAGADDTPGCYVCRSATLTRLYQAAFPGSGGMAVKIGYSSDIRDRALELSGRNSPRRALLRFRRKPPYAGFTDWTLWRYDPNAAGLPLPLLEQRLHARYARLPADALRRMQAEAGLPGPILPAREIFVGSEAMIVEDFPEVVHGA